MSIRYSLKELAEKFSVRLVGDGGLTVDCVAAIDDAGKGSITFLSGVKYKHYLQDTKATAVILSAEYVDVCPVAVLVSDNPYALYARIAQLLNPVEKVTQTPNIHPTAIISDNVSISESAIVGPNCVIGSEVVIGDDSVIGAGCVLESKSVLGRNTRLYPNVTVYQSCIIGDRVIIHAGAVIGADGFGFANEAGEWVKIPQVGAVTIGNDVEIGANTTVDRGAIHNTVIEDGVKLDNQIQIGHNAIIGAHTAMAGKVGVGGSAVIGKHCTVGGGTIVLGHLTVVDNTHINAFSLVTNSINEPGSYSAGTPLEPSASWRRNRARFKELNDMAKRLKNIEKEIYKK